MDVDQRQIDKGRYARVISADAYLVGDGTTVNSQGALDAFMAAAAGTCAFFPAGLVYNLGPNTLNPLDGTTFFGMGNRSRILSTGANLINLNFKGDVTVCGLTLDLAASGGQAIRVAGSSDCSIDDVTVIRGGTGTGIGVLLGSARTKIRGYRCAAGNYGLIINGGSTDTEVSDAILTGGTAVTSGDGHLFIPNADGVTLTNVVVRGAAGHGSWIGGASTKNVTVLGGSFRANGTAAGANDWRGITVGVGATDVKIDGTVASENYECGIYVEATASADLINVTANGNNTGLRPGGHGIEHNGSGKVHSCTTEGNLGNAADEGSGIFIGTGATSVIGNKARGNYSAGIRIVDAPNTIASNNLASNNSQRGVGLHDGIEVVSTGGTIENISVTGNRCWDDQATKTQKNGISFAGNVDYYLILGNNTRGNATGGISDGSLTNKTLANNL